MAAMWHGPLKATFLSKPAMTESADIYVCASGHALILVKHFSCIIKIKTIKTHMLSESHDDVCIRQGFSGRIKYLRQIVHSAFAIRHGAFFLGPARSRQEHVSIGRRIRLVRYILDHEEWHIFQSFAYKVGVGHADRRIRTYYPQRFERAELYLFKYLGSIHPWLGIYLLHSPEVCHFLTMDGIFEVLMYGQEARHATNLSAAHSIRLTC